MRALPCRIALLSMWCSAIACGDDTTEPVTGGLELTVSTTGRDLDPDGYTVTVDAGSPLAVPTNGSVSIPDLAPGVHTVTLTGLAGNCALTTPTPLEVTVPGAAGAVANVEITCTAIYTLAYRGESGVELTDAAGSVRRTLIPDADPRAWSPDGRLLAVSKPGEGVLNGVLLANLDEGGLTHFLDPGAGTTVNAGVWSPDGRELLLEFSGRGSHNCATSLRSYPLDQSYPPQRVYSIGECRELLRGVTWPDWSPDGSQIVTHDRLQTKTYILSPDGTSQRLLAEGLQPDWSPDGSAIAYVASVAGHATLRLIQPDGSNDRQLTAPATNETDTGPTWSPDGSKVAFVRLGHGPDSSVTSVHAYVVNRDGTNEQQLAVLPVASFHPTWSADGLHLAYSGSGGTYVVTVDGSGFRQVSTQPSPPAQWRP